MPESALFEGIIEFGYFAVIFQMFYIKLLYFFVTSIILTKWAEGKGAFKYVKYFEHLDYDPGFVQLQHNRVKRSIGSGLSGGHLFLNFQSHGRDFRIRLVRDTTLFHKDFRVENGAGVPIDADTSHIYHGNIWGKPNSLVHGSIIDGVFTGVIRDPDYGAYYVEEKDDFFGNKSYLGPYSSHSVIYHEKEVDFPHMYGPHKSCGASFTDIEKRMANYQKSFPAKEMEQLKRKKRSTSDERNTCHLYIQTDHMLWNELGRSRDRILAKISDHVKALNDVFRATVFHTSNNEKIRDIGFMVKRMVVNEDANADPRFTSTSIGVEKFLDLASSSNYNDYCLAYVFTQRDFDNGVLGLAWVGGVGSSGGICDKNRQYEGKAGKSLNTGIVTFMNYGATVPSRVSHITFAHEVGHNFGSPHDSGRDCTPGESFRSSAGNFIMFASATSGRETNNKVFSPCSVGNMSKVLEARREICFEASDTPICGNAIIDEGEECDCGYLEECQEVGDSECCHPGDDKERGCTLKDNKQCSVTQGPCCASGTCQFLGASTTCSMESDCRASQTCNGAMAQCPTAAPKPNRTSECNYGTQVCWGGECTGSICELADMEECSCPIPTEGDKSVACHACCKPHGGECKSTGDPAYHSFFNSTAILLQPGSPCDNFLGYCDMFSKCRKVDADGPLSRLKKAILNPELYRTIREWIVQYWWAVALMCLAAVMLMAGFIKLCSVHTPSNNPKLPKHRQLPGAETLRRRRQSHQRRQSQQRRQQQHQPLREMRR